MKTRSIDDRHISEILQMLRNDATYRAVAEHLMQAYGLSVSPETVRRTALRNGYQPRNISCADLDALGVPERRRADPPARRLRTLARRGKNLPNPADDDERLDSWLEKLDRYDEVVTWDPTQEYDDHGNLTESKGWVYRPRGPGDTGYIHVLTPVG